jgi:hypothetical protein
VILHPAALALLATSLLISGLGLHANYHGMRILGKWDLKSGSELQLELERRTYLISTVMSYILAFQLMSLFLYIYTADSLYPLFTGAMCAAGSLSANSFGYPVLILKIVNFLLAGVWLIVNHTDNKAHDYPLIRVKYELLNLLIPLLVLESCLLFAYFAGIKPDIITSCCGSLFSHESSSFGGEIASLPHMPMKIAFFAGMALTTVSGLFFYLKGKGGRLFSVVAPVTFLIAAASLVSFICLYFYELPTHHCPFCLLQKEYGHVGYVLYAALFTGGVAGLGTGVLMSLDKQGSMAHIIPPVQRRLTLVTIVCYLLFTLITSWKLIFSALRMG